MQRRAVAVFVVLFLVLGAGSYALIATATEPTFDVKGKTLQQGDTLTVSGTKYTVTTVEATESSGGGHGGGGGISYKAVFEWTNQSARYTADWQNNSTVQFDGKEWRVLVADGESPSSFTLTEDVNETAILMDDPNADDQLVTHNGTQYVVVREDGNRTLVPAEDYFPEPETREYDQGDTVDYQGNQTTFTEVSTGGVVLAWNAPKTLSTEVGQEGNVTLGDTTYFAYFPSPEGKEVVVSTRFKGLQNYNEEVDAFARHKNGLWGVSILSGLTSILLIGMAYLPSRY